MNKKIYMGRWELGCIVFNSLVYKMFTGSAESFAKYGGSAAWLTALFSGLIFLGLLWAALRLYSPYEGVGLTNAVCARFGKAAGGIVSVLFGLYFIFAILYAAGMAYTALNSVSYARSPAWYIMLFFAAGAVVVVLCGERAVRRMHSLFVLGIGLSVAAVVLLSLHYADIYNIFPILGKGAGSVFGGGLSAMFIYSDILVIFFLPKKGGKYSFRRTVMTSAAIAVAVNVAVVTAFSLNFSYELIDKIAIPLYPLTKAAKLGKFPARLDFAYQAALITSALLYLSLALSCLLKCAKTAAPKLRRSCAAIICLALCMSLCGCYDSREVEEKAYIIALGIDKGEEAKYKYTFQISNPLKSGGSTGADEKEEGNEDARNKTVNNIKTEADNYRLAVNSLKSLLSKEPDISHIKVIVFSYDVAKEGALGQGEFLMNEGEVRPDINICLSESAGDFLTSVNPTLEESTVRYYELFFRNNDVPFAPVTELRDFVSRSTNSVYDAVAPVAAEGTLSGMGIFSNGKLRDIKSGEDVLIYRLLCGDLRFASIGYENKSAVISSVGVPKVNVKLKNGAPEVDIEVRAKLNSGGGFDPSAELKKRCEQFLKDVYSSECDILGIRRKLRAGCITISEWEKLNKDIKNDAAVFSVKLRIE